MEQYIKKSALMAELNRLIAELVEEGEDTMFEQGRISAFEDVKVFINHTLEVKEVQEEPVSNDLEEAANDYAHDLVHDDVFETFIDGAQWQKEHLWKDAQGDDLPEIDKEVIALVRVFPEGHDDLLKVSFAHRPQEYWDGKNIATGEVTRYYPKRYDKGGWSIPDVKFWLDCELPKIKE